MERLFDVKFNFESWRRYKLCLVEKNKRNILHHKSKHFHRIFSQWAYIVVVDSPSKLKGFNVDLVNKTGMQIKMF